MSCYIKFGDIKGNSVDSKHTDWSDVLTWSWGSSNDSGGAFGSARTKGRSSTTDFVIVKNVDNASRDLMKACQSGGSIGTVKFEACKMFKKKDGEGEMDSYYTVEFTNTTITGVSTSGSEGGDATESISIRAEKIKYDHIPTETDGTRGSGSPVTYNTETNKIE